MVSEFSTALVAARIMPLTASDLLKLLISAICIVVAVFCYIFFCILGKGPRSFNQKFVNKCKEAHTVTNAHAIHVKKARDYYNSANRLKRGRYYVKYEYTVDGKTYHKTVSYSYLNSTSYIDLPIYYKATNPRRAAFNHGENSNRAFGCLLSVLFPAIIGIVGTIVCNMLF